MICAAADAVGPRQLQTEQGVIHLDGKWRWLPFYEGLSDAVGTVIDVTTPRDVLLSLAQEHGVPVKPGWNAGKIAMEIFGDVVEPTLIQPTFVCDYPEIAQPLARQHRTHDGLVEAWDLIIGGVERGTAFTELIDPHVQRARLTEQSLLAAGGDVEAMQLDEDFLRALEYAAPPMGGLGMGLDRVLMLLTDAGIRETILFPFLKPEST
jgi:lysyl-tRNA synthetase class 2